MLLSSATGPSLHGRLSSNVRLQKGDSVVTKPGKGDLRQGLERIGVLVDRIGRQTHAGAAMLTAAVLDRLLESALLSRFEKNNREVRDAIFGDFGVLRDFSSKIEMSFALGLIDREGYKSLHAIRRIRNLFAHSKDYVNFDSDAVQALIKSELPNATVVSSIESLLGVAEGIEARVCQVSGVPHEQLIGKLRDVL
jgi:DNA-binding MltR family transcriptional regulator